MTASYTLVQSTGIVTMDPRLGPASLWAAESSYTEQAPKPSITPGGAYKLKLEAGGTVEDSATALDLQVLDGGQPGRTTRAARMAWRTAAGTWRGWDLPSSIVGYTAVEVGSGTLLYARPSILALPSGVVLLAYTVGETGGDYGVGVRRMAAAGTAFGSRTLVHDDEEEGDSSHPRLVLAGKDVLLLHWVESADGSCWSIRVHISEDEGVTWSILRRYAVTDTDIDGTTYTRGRFAAAYMSGQLLVIAHLIGTSGVFDDKLRQYASGDMGATMVLIETQSGADSDNSGGYPDVVAVRGVFLLVYVQPNDGELEARRLGGAFMPLSQCAIIENFGTWNTDMATVVGAAMTDADVALAADDAGLCWVFARCADTVALTDNRCVVAVTGDGGLSFDPVGVSPLDPTDPDDTGLWWLPQPTGTAATIYPTNLSATFARGRVLIAHSHFATTATTDNSIGVLALGGWQSVTQPPTRRGLALGERAHWNRTWIPIERPDDIAGTYTTTTTGTGIASITAAGLLSTSTPAGAGTQFYHEDDNTNGALAFLGEIAVQVTAGGSTTTQDAGFTLRLSDGTSHGIEVRVQLSTTGFSVYDVFGAATIATVTGLASVARAYRIGAYSDGTSRRFQIWYRTHAALDEDRAWTLGASTSSLGDSFASGTTRVRWGCIQASTGTVALWHHLGWSVGDVTTGDQAVGTRDRWDAWVTGSSPTGLQGRLISTQHVYLGDGYTVRATAGPAVVGDSFTLQGSADYSIRNIFPTVSRSPRLGWRSVDDNSAQNIALALDTTILGAATGYQLAPLYALVLQGCNWRTGTLQYYSGGWLTAASIDLSIGGALTFQRLGRSYAANSATTPHFFQGELVGATLALAAGERPRIIGNFEGVWGTAYAGKQCRVACEGASGVAATGNCRIWSTRAAIVFAAPAAAGWRLVIDAQDTADGDLRVGSLLLGPCYLAPRQPDWQQQDVIEPGHRRQVRDDGSVSVSNQAPPYRLYTAGWTDGVDETQAWEGAPDYLSWGAGESPGSGSALPRSLASLVREHDGEQIALLPAVPSTSSVVTLVRYDQLLVGTLTTSVEREAVLGNELATQVQRVSAITVEEDP